MTTRSTSPRESSVVAKALQVIRERGGWATKVHVSTFQATVCPDILCCYRGKFVALEAKRDNKHKATRIQEFTIQEILAAGGIALVIWNTEMVTQILDTIDSWK